MIKLSDYSTRAPKSFVKEETKKKTAALTEKLEELVTKLHASKKYGLLIVFQGMDTSGKDGASRKVFSQCSPSMVNAYPFKKPTEIEFAHDFLWRAHKIAPAKGQVAIFTRSHYEDILIQRVHNWIDKDMVAQRMDAINQFESLLNHHNKTVILKFYMHISKEKQLEKLQERKDVLRKNWKHNDGDWKERNHWDEYMKAYEYALNESIIPWHIAPVDQRWYRDYFITNTIVKALQFLDLEYPSLVTDHV